MGNPYENMSPALWNQADQAIKNQMLIYYIKNSDIVINN
jgi:hypothetical protein